MNTILSRCILVSVSMIGLLFAQKNPFDELTEFKIDAGSSIFFVKSKCIIVDKPSKDDEDGFPARDILRSALIQSSRTQYLIRYSDGPSGDPYFSFYRIDKDTLVWIGGVGCDKLFLTGNQFFYTSGRTNNTFNKRAKFAIYPDTIIEVTQSFYYVGLESVTTREIIIYTDTTFSFPVATLSKGSAVTVVLYMPNDYYLLRTPFGLVGWANISADLYGYSAIKDLYFSGD